MSIAMDSQAQATAAAKAMTTDAINTQLQAVSIPAATVLSSPAVIASGSFSAAAPRGAGLCAALASLAALAAGARGARRFD